MKKKQRREPRRDMEAGLRCNKNRSPFFPFYMRIIPRLHSGILISQRARARPALRSCIGYLFRGGTLLLLYGGEKVGEVCVRVYLRVEP